MHPYHHSIALHLVQGLPFPLNPLTEAGASCTACILGILYFLLDVLHVASIRQTRMDVSIVSGTHIGVCTPKSKLDLHSYRGMYVTSFIRLRCMVCTSTTAVKCSCCSSSLIARFIAMACELTPCRVMLVDHGMLECVGGMPHV